MDIQKKDNESNLEYIKRIIYGKLVDKTIDCEYEDLSELIFGEGNCYNSSEVRKRMYGIKRILDIIEQENIKNTDNDHILKEYTVQKQELYKERQKLRDEKNELSMLLREQSRLELFLERIDESAEKMLSKKARYIPDKINIDSNDIQIIVSFADPHYDANFKIEGFNGEILNEYNPKIFEQRMWKLRDEIINFCNIHKCNKVSIVDLGDSIEGILHLSQLQALRGNIVDSIFDYSDFIVDWIDNLCKDLYIDFYTSEGNHSDLRLLTGKKGDFPHENLEKIYARILNKAYRNNPNVKINNSLNGLNYFNVNGYNILSAHGQNEKNIKNSIKDYEDTYNIKVDYFLVGHLHSKNEFEVSRGKEVIQVRSLMGINDFSTDIKKTSLAGATMFTVHKNYGKKYTNDVKF